MNQDIFYPVHVNELHTGAYSGEELAPPELQRIRWAIQGSIIRAAEYILAEDEYIDSNRKWIEFLDAEAVMITRVNIHPNVITTPTSTACIHRCDDSSWMRTFRKGDLGGCSHYQVLFYSDVLDVICRGLDFGHGIFGE